MASWGVPFEKDSQGRLLTTPGRGHKKTRLIMCNGHKLMDVMKQQLIDRGARKLMVANVPDISKIPETIEKAVQDPGILTRAAQVSVQFNQKLKEALARIEQVNGLGIIKFDLFAVLNSIVANGATNGLVFNDVACFDPDDFSYHPQCDFDRFVFFDNIHPTAAAHFIVGQAMLSVVRSADSATITGPLMLLLE